jgi:hypothetical protein
VDILSPLRYFLTNRNVDPINLSLAGAVLLPLLRELFRFKRSRSSSSP